MKDIELRLADQPGSLAAMALTLGEAGISVEGGGVFVADGTGIAHFLIADHQAATAADALRRADIEVVAVRDTVLARLRQDVPGQLGALCNGWPTRVSTSPPNTATTKANSSSSSTKPPTPNPFWTPGPPATNRPVEDPPATRHGRW